MEAKENKYYDFVYAKRAKRIWLFVPIVFVILAIEIGLSFIPFFRSNGLFMGLLFTFGCGLIILIGYKYFSNYSKSGNFVKKARCIFKTDIAIFKLEDENERIEVKYDDIVSIKGKIKIEMGIRYYMMKFKLKNKKSLVFKSGDTLKNNFKESIYFDIVKEFSQRNPNIILLNVKDYGDMEIKNK